MSTTLQEVSVISWNCSETLADPEDVLKLADEAVNPTIWLVQEVVWSNPQAPSRNYRNQRCVPTGIYGMRKRSAKDPTLIPNFLHEKHEGGSKQVVTAFSKHFQVDRVVSCGSHAQKGEWGIRHSGWVVAHLVHNPTVKFAVCNVHLQVPPKAGDGIHPNAALMLKELMKEKASFEAQQYITVLGGDFNTTPKPLATVLAIPSYVRPENFTNYDRKNGGTLRLDYVLVGGVNLNKNCESICDDDSSDHRKVNVSFLLG